MLWPGFFVWICGCLKKEIFRADQLNGQTCVQTWKAGSFLGVQSGTWQVLLELKRKYHEIPVSDPIIVNWIRLQLWCNCEIIEMDIIKVAIRYWQWKIYTCNVITLWFRWCGFGRERFGAGAHLKSLHNRELRTSFAHLSYINTMVEFNVHRSDPFHH